MGYTLKVWRFNEWDGWRCDFDPLPETLEDARSLANWGILHSPELRIEVQIIQGGKIIDTIETDELGNIIVKERSKDT